MDEFGNLETLFTPTEDKEENAILKLAEMLVTKDKNLPLKTEISDPLEFAVMGAMADYLEKAGLKKSSKLIKTILENHMMYMVSYKRKSRQELIDALRILTENEKNKEKNQSLSNRLTTPR